MAQMRPFSQAILCVSDVHLGLDTPDRLAHFCAFLNTIVLVKSSALYILGDLFTAWPGDEAANESLIQPLVDALCNLTDHDIPVYLLHGNHDFLLGQSWYQRTGIQAIQDGHILNWHDESWYLLHGDTLCTEDKAYQAFRTMVRDPHWQDKFLALPLSARLQEIEKVRGRSEAEKALKSEGIMDVHPDAVMDIWKQHPELTGMIHGHTHRPAEHGYRYREKHYTRWVLPDWIQHPGYGVLTSEGYRFTCPL
jgi:UDP-2,3-diacylglucosamine hydrolase